MCNHCVTLVLHKASLNCCLYCLSITINTIANIIITNIKCDRIAKQVLIVPFCYFDHLDILRCFRSKFGLAILLKPTVSVLLPQFPFVVPYIHFGIGTPIRTGEITHVIWFGSTFASSTSMSYHIHMRL